MTRQQFLILNLISARFWVLKSFKLEKNDSESEFLSPKRKIIKNLFEILKMKRFKLKLKNPAREFEGFLWFYNLSVFFLFLGTRFREDELGDVLEETYPAMKN